MKIKYLLLLSVICQQSITLKCQETLRSFGFANDGPDPFVQARERNQKLAEQKEQKQNAAQVAAAVKPATHVASEDFMQYLPTDYAVNSPDDCREHETKAGSDQNSPIDCFPHDLTTNLILPYDFEVDVSSPEALCESLTDYLIKLRYMLENDIISEKIYKQFMLQIKKGKLVKKYLEDKVCGPFKPDTEERYKILQGINIKDKQGNTALHFAAQRGYFETADILIANDIDINALANSDRYTFISLQELTEFRGVPITTVNKETIEKVSEKIKTGKIGKIYIVYSDWHALNDATINGHMDIAKLILQSKKADNFVKAEIALFSEDEKKHIFLLAYRRNFENLILALNEALPMSLEYYRLICEYSLDLDWENRFSLNDILNSYL